MTIAHKVYYERHISGEYFEEDTRYFMLLDDALAYLRERTMRYPHRDYQMEDIAIE